MGGVRCGLIQFKLEWHQDCIELVKKIKNHKALLYIQEENPRLARTVDEAPADLPTPREMRLHTPGPQQLKIRFFKICQLGSGDFGTVHKAIDIDSGKLIAVKIIERPINASKRKQEDWRKASYNALKREVENLSKISHVSKASLPLFRYRLIQTIAIYCRLYCIARLGGAATRDLYRSKRRLFGVVDRD